MPKEPEKSNALHTPAPDTPKPVVDEPVKTVQQEQLERSAEIDAEGVEKWKARRDDRDPKDRPIVAGIANLLENDDKSKKK